MIRCIKETNRIESIKGKYLLRIVRNAIPQRMRETQLCGSGKLGENIPDRKKACVQALSESLVCLRNWKKPKEDKSVVGKGESSEE